MLKAFFVIFTATALTSVLHGISTPPAPHNSALMLSSALRFWFISEISHIIAISLLRLSLALQLFILAKSLFQRGTLLAVMSITIFYNSGFFLLVLFQCDPIQYFWTGWNGKTGQAINAGFVELASYGFAGVGAGCDWVLVLSCPWFIWSDEMVSSLRFCLRLLMIVGIW